MAQVTITMNGRHYAVGCADGEEARLRNLAAELDRRLSGLVGEVGQIGDARLLVMLGLLLLDEMEELRVEAGGGGSVAEERVAAIVESLADRVESLAARLEGT